MIHGQVEIRRSSQDCRPADEAPEEDEDDTNMKRSNSCPNIALTELLDNSASKIMKTSGQKNKLRFSSGAQTDPSLDILPYVALFPMALPLPGTGDNVTPLPLQQLLESYNL